MGLTAWARVAIANRLKRFTRHQIRTTLTDVLPQLLQYHHSADEERLSYHEHIKDPSRKTLRDRLEAAGVAVEDAEFDVEDFHRWLARWPQLTRYYTGGWAIEKCLEHYLAYRALRPSRGEVYVDVGAARSPFAPILRKEGVRAYRLDRLHRPGIHGMNIGADAAHTGLRDGFASAVSAQDAYSLFAADTDILFVREAVRILNDEGRFVVVPLFLAEQYINILDPWSDLRSVAIDPGAKRVWRDNPQDIAFARHYSPESFHDRVWTRIPETMTSRVLYFGNVLELRHRYPEQHIYAFFLLYSEKRSRGGRRVAV